MDTVPDEVIEPADARETIPSSNSQILPRIPEEVGLIRRSVGPRLVWALVLICLVGPAPTAQAIPPCFIEETLIAGLDRPVGLSFAPDGRMFFWEQAGRVYFVDPGGVFPQLLIDISSEVGLMSNQGLLGFALAPDFYNTGEIYLFYTVDWEYWITGGQPDPGMMDRSGNDTFGRLARYACVWEGDFEDVVCGNREILLGSVPANGIPITSKSHGPGTIAFAADGSLLASVGDGACWQICDGQPDVGGCRTTTCSDGTAEVKGILHPEEMVGAFRAQLLNSHSGKILRLDVGSVDPVLGAAGVPSNPFFDAVEPRTPRSRVWALGLRNPYRFCIRPGSGSPDPGDGAPGVLYVGNVGWSKWEELEIVRTGGANLGWPLFEGLEWASSFPGIQVDNRDAPNPLFDGSSCLQEFFYFTDLIRQDGVAAPTFPNPCEPSVEIPSELAWVHQRPALEHRHNVESARIPGFDNEGIAIAIDIDDPVSPVEGDPFGGKSVLGGVFYVGDKFPAEYRDTYFEADSYGQGPSNGLGWIRNIVVDPASDTLLAVRPFRDAGDGTLPAALAVDPAGYGLYLVHHNFFTGPNTGQIRRITYDCNGNGAADDEDITLGASQDIDGNGIPDECDAAAGDMNCDGAVDMLDVAPFVLALLDPAQYDIEFPDCNIMIADATNDCRLDGADIRPFTVAVIGR
ncbi:MAG: PQQ-dependent sugar dehydrogenase [Planctomycetota bacterium]|nr:PQQ-dependent sugar dehydrogenase [Planctomycetota bacterium]